MTPKFTADSDGFPQISVNTAAFCLARATVYASIRQPARQKLDGTRQFNPEWHPHRSFSENVEGERNCITRRKGNVTALE
jgi:hypothetical protein